MKKSGEPSWRYRRFAIYVTVAFCFWGVATLIDGSDTELNRTIVSGLLWLAGSVVIGYIFGATAQDAVAIASARTGRPYSMDMSQADPPQNVGTTVNVDRVTE
jgi:hypothetical protein